MNSPCSFIHWLSACELEAQIIEKKVSCVEIIETAIERVEKYDGEINAVVVRLFDSARARAKEADEALNNGIRWGPLHGIPITIKEDKMLKGTRRTFGSPAKRNVEMDEETEPAILRLIEAGAIVIGKTNLPVNMNDVQSYNPIYGLTRNPYDLSRTPGGSSGGSAASVCAGFVPIDIGGDIGGSIRYPANCCGLFGLKPTHGLVPKANNKYPNLVGIDVSVNGPITRSLDDLTLVLELMIGPNKHDHPTARCQVSCVKCEKDWSNQICPCTCSFTNLRYRLPLYYKPLAQFRVAFWKTDGVAPVGKEIISASNKLINFLKNAGCTVVEDKPDFDSKELYCLYRYIMGSVVSSRTLTKEEYQSVIGKKNKLSDNDKSDEAEEIRAMTLSYYEFDLCNQNRALLIEKYHEFFNKYDILIAPISCCVAPPVIMQNNNSNSDNNSYDNTQMPFWRKTNRKLKIEYDELPEDVDEDIKEEVNNGYLPYHRQVFWASMASLLLAPSLCFPVSFIHNDTYNDNNSGSTNTAEHTVKRVLPIGLQAMGPHLSDSQLIYFVNLLAQECEEKEEKIASFLAPVNYISQ